MGDVGVNGGNGKCGVDYGKFSPRFRSYASWFDYMEPYEKFSRRIHQVSSGHPCPYVNPRQPS